MNRIEKENIILDYINNNIVTVPTHIYITNMFTNYNEIIIYARMNFDLLDNIKVNIPLLSKFLTENNIEHRYDDYTCCINLDSVYNTIIQLNRKRKIEIIL